jgi:methionyl-tRNA synthetase
LLKKSLPRELKRLEKWLARPWLKPRKRWDLSKMDEITFEDFSKIDFRVGKVTQAENIGGAESLIRLKVDFGPLGERTILSGIKKWYTPEDLKGNTYIFVFNLAPKKMMGEASQGMIMAAEDTEAETCVLLIPDKDIPAGTKVH